MMEVSGGSESLGSESSGSDQAVMPAVPLEVLEHRLAAGIAEISAREAEWLGWLAEFDERGGHESWGCVSAAHWLMWRCGLGANAARERVRVARALGGLPLIAAQFRVGRLTWSKVRALTRVANPANESDLVALAVEATGSQLERICRAMRSVGGDENEDAAVAFASRSWSKRHNHDGTTTLTLRVTDDAAHRIEAELERQVTADLDDAAAAVAHGTGDGRERSRRELIEDRNGIAAVRADAAVVLLTSTTDHDPLPCDVTLIVNADVSAETSSDPGSGPLAAVPNSNSTNAVPAAHDVSAETPAVEVLIGGDRVADPVGRRLCCDVRVTALVESARDGGIGVGRSHRFVTPKLRRALEHRDHGTCRFPGCCATRRLHAHHIVHWLDGGETELDNLILVCSFHHHQIHDNGWRVDPQTRAFVKPNGHRADPHTTIASTTIDRLVNDLIWTQPEPAPLPAGPNDPLDLHWVVAVIAGNAELQRPTPTK